MLLEVLSPSVFYLNRLSTLCKIIELINSKDGIQKFVFRACFFFYYQVDYFENWTKSTLNEKGRLTSLRTAGWGQYSGGAGRYKPTGTKPQSLLLKSLAEFTRSWNVSERMSASAITAAFSTSCNEPSSRFTSSSSMGSTRHRIRQNSNN